MIFDPRTQQLMPRGEELAFAGIESLGRFLNDWTAWQERGPANLDVLRLLERVLDTDAVLLRMAAIEVLAIASVPVYFLL